MAPSIDNKKWHYNSVAGGIIHSAKKTPSPFLEQSNFNIFMYRYHKFAARKYAIQSHVILELIEPGEGNQDATSVVHDIALCLI